MLQNELNVSKIYHALNKVFKTRQYIEKLDYLMHLKKHFLHWQTQIDKIDFVDEIHSEQ